MKRKVLIFLSGIALCFAVIVGRAIWDGRSALQNGDAALAKGDPSEAIVQWRRAARWYVPMAPHVDAAYSRLQAMALASEKEGKISLALQAWRGIRSSIRATRSFYAPHAEKAPLADQHIAQLMAKQEKIAGSQLEEEALSQAHLKLLEKDSMPSMFWSVFAILGLAIWVGSGFAFALRGVGSDDRLRPVAAAYSGAGIGLGLLVWLLGLSLA